MNTLAPLLLGVSVTLLTTVLWPRRSSPPVQFQFVEEERVPRTIH